MIQASKLEDNIKLEEDAFMQTEDDVNANEDGDEVVRTIDLFLSPTLSEQMYLVQFPLQSSSNNSVPQQPESARIKKKHNLLELEHPIPYSKIGSEGNFSFLTRKQISHTIPIGTHMALGKLADDGSIHLVPFSHMTQMRPDFCHVNLQDETSDDQPEETAKAPEKKPLLFQKKESERAAMIRKSSYAYKKASEEEEEWQDLIICGPQTPEYNECQRSLLEDGRKSIAGVSGSEKDFVKTLNYIPRSGNDGDDGDEMDQPPITSDDQEEREPSPLVSVVKKCIKLLSRGVPVPFSVIRLQIQSSIDDRDLIQALSSCSVLVRGNFYLQSRLCAGLDPDLVQARTLILYLLQTDGKLQRKGIEAAYLENDVVTSEWIHTILQQVSLRCRHGWTTRLTDNLTFLAMFPEQTELHNQYWERVGNRLQEELDIYRSTIGE